MAGEVLDAGALDAWRRVHPGTIVANVYGPTETTVSCAQLVIPPGVVLDPGPVPVGVPLPGARLFVVGVHGELMPPGATGELLIGGPGVAEGYLEDADETAASFGWTHAAGRPERIYRSGDLGRWDARGRLVVLGRMDGQVKVNGVRVEPLEVDAVLASHPRVSRSVTVGRRDPRSGAMQLVSHVATGEPGLSERSLQEFVSDRLPRHLVPARIELSARLPLTAHGKVDVAALDHVDSRTARRVASGRAPEGVLEVAVAEAWSSILQCDELTAEDDFFAVGGHSLAAMRVAALLSRELGRDVRVETVLAVPVLEDLAAALGGIGGSEGNASSDIMQRQVPLVPDSSRPRRVQPSRSQLQMWMLAELDPAASAAYTLGGAMTLLGPLDVDALREAIDAVVARHDALRTSIAQDLDGEVLATVWPHQPCGLPVRAFHSADDRARREQVRAALEQPFDLGRAPLVRMHLFRSTGEEHVLALALHHVAVDGWSLQLVVAEIGDTYRAITAGRPATRPPDAATTQGRSPSTSRPGVPTSTTGGASSRTCGRWSFPSTSSDRRTRPIGAARCSGRSRRGRSPGLGLLRRGSGRHPS